MWEAPWCKDAWRLFMSRALAGRELEDFPTAAEPAYDNPFNEKQAASSEEAAKDLIARLNGASLEDMKAALGSDLAIEEAHSADVPAGGVISIEYANGSYAVKVSLGQDTRMTSENAPAQGELPQQQTATNS